MGKVGGIGGSDRWDERFLAVQGHRLVWWSSEDDVDSGLVSGRRSISIFSSLVVS